MSELYLQQQTLLYVFERSLENFKKIGKNNYTPSKIRSRITSMKDSWSQFLQGHAALSHSIPAEKRLSYEYFKLNQFDLAYDFYQNTLDYMQECLDALEPTVKASASGSAIQNKTDSTVSLAHLPQINISPFSGRFEEWESFRDRFTSLIIHNKELSDVARMHFLTSFLSGRALDSIKNLPITADNFAIAWKTITSRFENKRRLVEVHISALYHLPTVTRESAHELNNLRDQADRAISSLRNLKRTSDEIFSDMLVYSVSQKLDPATRKAWKFKLGEEARIPSYDELNKFLAARANALEEFSSSTNPKCPRPQRPSNVTAATASTTSCPLCRSAHFINKCPQFIKRSPSQRLELIKQHKRCFNCFSSKHTTYLCSNKYTCRICNKRHHTMLHIDSVSFSSSASSATAPAPTSSPTDSPSATVLSSTRVLSSRPPVLLATALVAVEGSLGRRLVIRALLDPGSELTFISERLGRMLKVKRIRSPISISAVGGVDAGTTRYSAQIKISPCDSSGPVITVVASILKVLTTYSPSKVESFEQWNHLSELSLADPDPTSSDPIDLIIGSDIYSEIILDGLHKGRKGEPLAQRTIFGWVLSGSLASQPVFSRRITAHCANFQNLETEMRKFWEVEEIPRQVGFTPEENQCEEHFLATHSRDSDGRYIVRLPFKKDPPIQIGDSRHLAERQLRYLHRRFRSQPSLKAEYADFMEDYNRLGHMREIDSTTSGQSIYIPHHPVFRESSVTTRLRVVFNASCPTSNKTSLNDHLLVGPKLQTDITDVILRWRQHRYVLSADIAKMYRQILVDSRDTNYQRIVWSSDDSDSVRDYQLLTVTYGTVSAPFLALRVLRQLISDEGDAFPLAVSILQDNIYVDDVLFGADDIPLVSRMREQICALLKRGQFELRKWSSNASVLLRDIDVKNHGLACNKTLHVDDHIKILGIGWNPSNDQFQIRVTLTEHSTTTKRSILSTIARIFDPFGWVTPVTIAAKILMQRLWLLKVGWDDNLPSQLLEQWKSLHSSLNAIDGTQIARWTNYGADTLQCELHGFSDASNAAYAAVVYLRVLSMSGETSTSILIGKSKVAPVKSMSVPRLELSAALLLARLISFILKSLSFATQPIYCWTDSTVVLAWLQQHPSKWKTFVANRVSEIQTTVPSAQWRHVSTHDNPADCASRGIQGHELVDHPLWWRGPVWLSLAPSEWPSQMPCQETALEKNSKSVSCATQSGDPWDLPDRFSSWPKLLRVTAYIVRFVTRSRANLRNNNSVKQDSLALSSDEIRGARIFWIQRVQSEVFPREKEFLLKGKVLSPKSAISSLTPFLDEDKLIRVGGRLQNAPVSFSVKHPILLAAHPVVQLIIRRAHLRSLHAGTQLTLTTLRQEFWVLRSRSLVKALIHSCVVCSRAKATLANQLMGNLPQVRVSPPSRAFLHCGLDYAGPMLVRALSGRGGISHKAYIALWVCLSTRAIHVELVDGYSTAAFLAAYQRFCARRGLPESIYSDNGTTFVGANRELARAFHAARRDPDFQNRTASDGVSWHFIPPSAPHFGGIWEAGVRSVKHHLRRVIGTHTLTYEELTTLLCNVEASLNSRPLAPLTDSADDHESLTPSHFLIGAPLTAVPEPSVLHLNENRLSRWQLIRCLYERFWKAWSSDYVNTLQQRVKWRTPSRLFRVGQLVLVHNSTLPPCKWDLGRVTKCHTGSDGLVRVVTVKTATSEYTRPIAKICLLPIDIERKDGLASSPDKAEA